MHLTHPLTPAGPEKETSITLYDFGGATITSTGPRGGWSCMSLSAEALDQLEVILAARTKPTS